MRRLWNLLRRCGWRRLLHGTWRIHHQSMPCQPCHQSNGKRFDFSSEYFATLLIANFHLFFRVSKVSLRNRLSEMRWIECKRRFKELVDASASVQMETQLCISPPHAWLGLWPRRMSYRGGWIQMSTIKKTFELFFNSSYSTS